MFLKRWTINFLWYPRQNEVKRSQYCILLTHTWISLFSSLACSINQILIYYANLINSIFMQIVLPILLRVNLNQFQMWFCLTTMVIWSDIFLEGSKSVGINKMNMKFKMMRRYWISSWRHRKHENATRLLLKKCY